MTFSEMICLMITLKENTFRRCIFWKNTGEGSGFKVSLSAVLGLSFAVFDNFTAFYSRPFGFNQHFLLRLLRRQ